MANKKAEDKRKELQNAIKKGNMELVSVFKSNYKFEI